MGCVISLPRGGVQAGRQRRHRRSGTNSAAHSKRNRHTALLAGMIRLPRVLPFRSYSTLGGCSWPRGCERARQYPSGRISTWGVALGLADVNKRGRTLQVLFPLCGDCSWTCGCDRRGRTLQVGFPLWKVALGLADVNGRSRTCDVLAAETSQREASQWRLCAGSKLVSRSFSRC